VAARVQKAWLEKQALDALAIFSGTCDRIWRSYRLTVEDVLALREKLSEGGGGRRCSEPLCLERGGEVFVGEVQEFKVLCVEHAGDRCYGCGLRPCECESPCHDLCCRERREGWVYEPPSCEGDPCSYHPEGRVDPPQDHYAVKYLTVLVDPATGKRQPHAQIMFSRMWCVSWEGTRHVYEGQGALDKALEHARKMNDELAGARATTSESGGQGEQR
jgi:hypothetical protein